jgi:hypothetical protein
MRGKLARREARRTLSDTIDRLGDMVGREFADVEADFVLVVEHRGLVSLMSSLEDPQGVRALLAEGARGNDGWQSWRPA